MASRAATRLGRWIEGRLVARWTDRAEAAGTARISELRRTVQRARELRRRLNQFLFRAERRMAQVAAGRHPIDVPLHTDWSDRPTIWAGPVAPQAVAGAESGTNLGGDLSVFHDCPRGEITLTQTRNTRERDLAPYGLTLEVFHFEGSFLSVVFDLDKAALEGLTAHHIVRLDALVEAERPIEIFARLNVRHGPNTEQIVREFDLRSEEVEVEFDLAYTGLSERRLERIWMDLIFENPAMNRVRLRDIVVSRRPRAEV